jgi:hypothetical protein
MLLLLLLLALLLLLCCSLSARECAARRLSRSKTTSCMTMPRPAFSSSQREVASRLLSVLRTNSLSCC